MSIATRTIRALFAGEKPPVPDAEWDEAAYVEQRLRAYREALGSLASVRSMPSLSGCGDRGYDCSNDERDGRDPVDEEAIVASAPGVAELSCPRTGDRAIVDFGGLDAGARETLRTDLEGALQRVFADAHAWRRCLLPAYFERHRSWRAVAGAPIQH